MQDLTISNSTAHVSDIGVSVDLQMSSTDLASLLRYGTVSVDQAPRMVGVGSVHVEQITVELI